MFDKNTTNSNDLVCVFIDDDGGVVSGAEGGGVGGAEEVEAGLVGGETWVGYDGEDGEDCEVASGVVCPGKGTNMKVRMQLPPDLDGNAIRIE